MSTEVTTSTTSVTRKVRTAGPLVTVVAVCYNHERFVIECLESIRRQTYTNIQLIVMDDCSTDGSVGRIDGWLRDNSVECLFIKHQRNQGICRTLNEALGHARGKYFSFNSTDDVWLDDKIAAQVAEMEEAPEGAAVIYSDAYRIDEAGASLPETYMGRWCKDCSHNSEGAVLNALAEHNFIPAVAALVRTEAVRAVGGFDERLIYEDYDLWLRLARRYSFIYSDRTLTKYRVVSTSLSNSFRQSNGDYLLSHSVVMNKALRAGGLDESLARLLCARENSYIADIHRLPYRVRHRYLWKAFKLNPTARKLTHLACSLAFIPADTLSKVAAWLRGKNKG